MAAANPASPDRELMSAADVSRTISRIAHQIIEKTALDAPDAPRVVLLGIPTRGVTLAARLAEKVKEFADVTQGVEGSAHGPTGVEHVVDEDDQRPVDAALGNGGVLQGARRLEVEVVAVERDVQRPARHRDVRELLDLVGQPGGQGDAPGRDAEKDDFGRTGRIIQSGLFDDLMGDAGDGPADVRSGHQLPVGA